VLSRFERYRAAAIEAYDKYEFHKVYRATVELCAVDLSRLLFRCFEGPDLLLGQALA